MALGAAVAAVGVASHASAQSAPDGTVTYVMSINDDGFGDYVPGSFAIYAIDGTVSGFTVTPNQIAANSNGVDGGIDNFDLTVNGGVVPGTLRDDIYSGSTVAGHVNAGIVRASSYYQLTDAAQTSGLDSTIEAGVTYGTLHVDNSNTIVGAGQDTVGSPPSLANVNAQNNATLIIFGLGQSAGNLRTFATSTTGNNPGTPAGTSVDGNVPKSYPFAGPVVNSTTYAPNTFITGLLIASGSYSGSLPSIDMVNSTTGLLAAYDEPYSSTVGGWMGAGSSTQLELLTQTLGVPEPASVGLFGLGAMGLLGRRRRRDAAKK
jgi:hypothetical protein